MSLTPAELAGYRAEQERHLPSFATVERMTRTRDATGTMVESYAPLLSAGQPVLVPARRGLATNAELRVSLGDRWTDDPHLVVTVPHGADVLVEDRVTLEGERYLVVGHLSQESWETARRLAVVSI